MKNALPAFLDASGYWVCAFVRDSSPDTTGS